MGAFVRKIGSLLTTRDRVARWLFVAFVACSAIHVLLFVLLVAHGESPRQAIEQLPLGDILAMRSGVWTDSWWPMLKAYDHYLQHPDENLYALFSHGVKFQYPPSALLPCELLPESWRVAPDDRVLNAHLMRLLSWASRLAVVGTWFEVAWLTVVARDRLMPSETEATGEGRVVVFALALALAATFYPVVHSYRLGQVQVFMNAAVGVALLAFLLDRRALAGAILAACTLIKPQFGLLLLWSLLRRERRFSAGYALCLGVGLVASLWRFGLANHLAYLDVLKTIGRIGESAYVNQSVNGLLNRWLGNGVVVPQPGAMQSNFAPYHPGIHAATTATSLLILLLAFEPWNWRRKSGSVLDLSIMIAAATMAAPVAWNHHYGAFLPIFAVVLPLIILSGRRSIGKGVALGLSFLLIGFEFIDVEWFLQTPFRVFLFSHVFFGAILLFALMLRLRPQLTKLDAEAERKKLVPASAQH